MTDVAETPAPRVPRYGPVAIAAFVGLVVCSNIATASWAALDNEHPARLLMLSARNRFLVVTVPSGISPITWSLLAFSRLGTSALVCHLVGRAYGEMAGGLANWRRLLAGLGRDDETSRGGRIKNPGPGEKLRDL